MTHCFQGTEISLIQFPTVEVQDNGGEVTRINHDVTKIPASYTMTPL